ncbi:MAG: zinc-ribbon domain-containing protein, partial [Methanoregula sp.]|nr:zinc-ribbon domain-containing protein [Methanoregula sp.]
MAYPDLYSDETVVLNAQNIKVKSVSFEAVLTTRRLILVDSKKHLIAPQEILLATLRDIEMGENAIRDPTIMLSIITTTGATRQMILTFSKTSGGERRRECDEWVKVLRQQISSGVQHPIMPDVPSPEEYPTDAAEAQPYSPRVEVTNIPTAPSPKKKIEIARPGPMKKIVEAAPAMPTPVETTTLPTGSFCNKCGSRVPPESAFCNKCGTPVVTEADLEARLTGTAEAPAPAVPQVQMHSPPMYGAGNDRKDRPIEDVIHSIEPLIEDSVPRMHPYPLVPKQQYQPATAPEEPVANPAAAPGPESTAPDTAAPSVSEVKWPVLGSASQPPDATTAAAGSPHAPPPVPAPAPRSKKPIMIGVIAIVIIAIIAAVFIFANPLGGGSATPAVTTT